VPRIHRDFTGTGDLFAALMLAWTTILKKENQLPEEDQISIAFEKCINSLQAILKRTEETNSKELSLIQSKQDIEQPTIIYKRHQIF
jgi:pyridoxine kinase